MSNKKVQLTDNGDYLFPNPNLIGIDTDNVIFDAILLAGNTYTAQEDCFISIGIDTNRFRIDGVILSQVNGELQPTMFLLKKDKF